MSKLKRKLDNGIECCMVQYTYAVYNAHAQNAGRLSSIGLDWHMQYKQYSDRHPLSHKGMAMFSLYTRDNHCAYSPASYLST